MLVMNVNQKDGERLQKVTNPDVEVIRKKDRITVSDLAAIKPEDINFLNEKINEIIDTLKGSELDSFIDKIEGIIIPEPEIKNQKWEQTHKFIISTMDDLFRATIDYRPWPKSQWKQNIREKLFMLI
jgi:hypothetical protein